jgi:hypothetical protein
MLVSLTSPNFSSPSNPISVRAEGSYFIADYLVEEDGIPCIESRYYNDQTKLCFVTLSTIESRTPRTLWVKLKELFLPWVKPLSIF